MRSPLEGRPIIGEITEGFFIRKKRRGISAYEFDCYACQSKGVGDRQI